MAQLNILIIATLFSLILAEDGRNSGTFIFTTTSKPPKDVINCCSSGYYDLEKNACFGPGLARYDFQIDCKQLIDIRTLELDEEILNDPLSIENLCYANVKESKYQNKTQSAYFICVEIDEELKITFEKWFYPFSILFLIITLYLYIDKLGWLRSPQDLAFIYAISCLTLYMILFVARHSINIPWIKMTYNYAGRYFKIAYLSWFNMMLLNRLLENAKLFIKPTSLPNIWPFLSHLYAWLVPLGFILLNYNITSPLNWHIPILVLYIVNVILLVLVMMSVECHRRRELRIWLRNRYRSRLLLALFIFAGSLWVIGSNYRIPIFTSLFGCQGILIFLIMVIYRHHAKRKLGGMKFCCILLPKRWENVPKHDEDDIEPTELCTCDLQGDTHIVIKLPIINTET